MGWLLLDDKVIGFYANGFRNETPNFDILDECFPWDFYGFKYNGDQIVRDKVGKVIIWNGVYVLALNVGIFMRIGKNGVEVMRDDCIEKIIRTFGIRDTLASKQMKTISMYIASGYISIPKQEFFMEPRFKMQICNVSSDQDLFDHLDGSFKITDIRRIGDFAFTLFEKEMQWKKI